MSREIKFRGIRRDNGEFVYGYPFGEHAILVPDGELIDTSLGALVHGIHPIKMGSRGQFTGLHDKNGREIYEGDIVKVPVLQLGSAIGNIYNDALCEVGFNCGTFIVKYSDRHGLTWTKSLCGEGPESMEIIGNRFENPELMEAGE